MSWKSLCSVWHAAENALLQHPPRTRALQSPMYVMYLDVSNPRKPKLLSTGRMPLSVHYSQVRSE